MKRNVLMVLVLIMVPVMVFCGGGSDSGDELTTVYIAGTSGATDTQSIAHMDLAERLNALGGWAAEARIGGVMGETDDVTEQAIQGVPVLAASDPGRIASYVPEYGVIQAPYVLPDHTYLNTLLDTEIYKGWEEDFRAHGIELITSNCFSGARSYIGDEPFYSPSDLNGVTIRTIGSELFTKSVAAMGATPIPLAWGETYQGLEQGVVDGTEAQIPGIYSMRFYEVADTISLSEHFLLIGSIVTGTAWYDTLSEEQQVELRETARVAYKENQALVVELSQKYIDEMVADHGMTVVEVDKEPFIESVQPVYEELGYTELVKELYSQLGL